MSKDKYAEDHFIEVAGSGEFAGMDMPGIVGNTKTLFVSDNLNVLKLIRGETLNVEDLTCTDLIVRDDATFGTDPEGTSMGPGSKTAKFTILDSEIDVSSSYFSGTVDMGSVGSSNFLANGFTSDDSIAIRSTSETAGDSLSTFARRSYFGSSGLTVISGGSSPSSMFGPFPAADSSIFALTIYDKVASDSDVMIKTPDDILLRAGTTGTSTSGSVIVTSSKGIVIKSTSGITAELLESRGESPRQLELINSAGATAIPFGVYLGGGTEEPIMGLEVDRGRHSPIGVRWSWGKHGRDTNDKYSGSGDNGGLQRVRNSGFYGNWPAGSGFYADGWVIPKLEVGYTSWSGHARAIDDDGETTAREGGTASWLVAVPLPLLWDDDIEIMGLNYTVRRLKNLNEESFNRAFEGDRNSNEGSTGTLEFVGGSMFPAYKYVNSRGDTVEVRSDSDGHANFMGAYISYEEGSSRYKHLVIRIDAGKPGTSSRESDFHREYGLNQGAGGGSASDDSSLLVPKYNSSGEPTGTTHDLKNVIGIRVKVVLFYVRHDS